MDKRMTSGRVSDEELMRLRSMEKLSSEGEGPHRGCLGRISTSSTAGPHGVPEHRRRTCWASP